MCIYVGERHIIVFNKTQGNIYDQFVLASEHVIIVSTLLNVY